MKRICLLIAMLITNVTSVVVAQTRVKIGDLYYQLSGDEASVASNSDGWLSSSDYRLDKYEIPAYIEYNGLIFNVTSIQYGAFAGNQPTSANGGDGSSASSVILSNSIIKIGGYAFCRCLNLTTMVVPSSVLDVGPGAFSGCSLLRTLIYLPSKAPLYWTATTNTYVPSLEEYSSPSYEINDAKVIEMLTFNDKATTYGEAVDIHDHKVNIADCGDVVRHAARTVHERRSRCACARRGHPVPPHRGQSEADRKGGERVASVRRGQSEVQGDLFRLREQRERERARRARDRLGKRRQE